MGKFHPDFFGYIMIVLEDRLTASGTGLGGQTELARKTIEGFEISFPHDIEEQRRTVAVLDGAFAAIATATANAEKNLANARELMHAATVARLKPQEEGWVEKSLGSFCDIYQPETISKKQMSDDGDYPRVRREWKNWSL